MSRKSIVRFWLIVGFLALFFYFLVRKNLTRDYRDLEEAMGVTASNISYEIMPPRSAPFGVDTKQIELITTFEPAFDAFTQEDWQEFWQVIYGLYPEYASDNRRIPPRKRQLTMSEIQEELRILFRYPFASFGQEHWERFWKIFKIRK